MPITYRIIPDRDLVVLRLSGQASAARSVAVVGEMRADPDFRAHFHTLIDMRAMTGTDQSGADFARDADALQADAERVHRPVKHAIVANTPTARAMAEMQKNFFNAVPGLSLRIFDEAEAAVAWLGLPGTADDYLASGGWRGDID